MKIGRGEFLLGDCFEHMANIPDGSVDMILTSPPYDNLRTYNDSEAWTFDSFKGAASQIARALKDGGVVVWNVADATIAGSETGSSFRQALHFKDVCGLNIHDTMIWQKPNFSNPSRTRYHQTFEFVFIFSKGKPSTFNPIIDRKNVYAGRIGSRGLNSFTKRDGTKGVRERKVNSEFGMRHNVWLMNTSGQNRETSFHPATFPVSFARDHILSWSREGDIILDPFAGSGTTAIAAENSGRNWICIERDPDYYAKATERVTKHVDGLRAA